MQPPPRPGFPPPFAPPPQSFPPPNRPPFPGQHQRPMMGFAPAPPIIAQPQIIRQPTGGANPSQSTTLWVGKIAPSITAADMRAILETCGAIKEWKPATDPKTGTMKGFGFCTYNNPDSVIVAMNLLNGFLIDGQALSLKCNSATDQFVTWYKTSNADTLESRIKTLEEDAHQKLAVVLKNRLQGGEDASAAATDFLASLSQPASERGEKRRREDDRDNDDRRGRRQTRHQDIQKEREEDRQYRDRLHAYELRERDRLRDARRYKERLKDMQRDRQRLIKEDNEGLDSDDEREAWERKPYYKTRRCADRRKRRERELQYDEDDIKMEKRREEERRKRAERDAKLAAERKKELESQKHQSIMETTVSKKTTTADGTTTTTIKPTITAPRAEPATKQLQLQQRRRALSGFDDEDENKKDDKERKLIPIQYTEEELRAVKHDDAGNARVSHRDKQSKDNNNKKKEVDPETAKRQLIMSKIPKDKDAVFAYNVKWNYYDIADDTVKNRIVSWVSKKIKELMGEEEPSFCEFITSILKAHESPREMYDKLKDVLDEDASSFVTKLFQVVIYETEKLAAG